MPYYEDRDTYIGRQTAWHGQGTVTGKYQTTAELLADKTFQFDLFKSQLHDGLGRLVDAWGIYRWNHDDKARRDMQATRFLSSVGKDYTIIPFAEGFKTIDALMQTANHGAHYETAGTIDHGAKLWALADLGLRTHVGADEHKNYLLFATSYDGSMSHTYKLVDERVVCRNTFAAAMSEKTTAMMKVKATKNALNKLVKTREILESMGQDVKVMEDRLNFLATRKLTKEAYTEVVDRLFPKAKDDEGKERDTTRRTNILNDILRIYEFNDGDTFKEQRGTSYNLLNAITNYVDHERMSDSTARVESATFGSGDALKTKASEVIYEVSQGLSAMTMGYSGDLAAIGLNI